MVQNLPVLGAGDTLLIASPFAATLVLALGVWWMRRRRIRRQPAVADKDAPRCARCGYDLRGQTLPRCPECGTLRGFRVPMEGLGLTEAELQDYAREKAARAAGTGRSGAVARDDANPPPEISDGHGG